MHSATAHEKHNDYSSLHKLAPRTNVSFLKGYYCECKKEAFPKGVDKKMQQVCHYPVTALKELADAMSRGSYYVRTGVKMA